MCYSMIYINDMRINSVQASSLIASNVEGT